MQILKAESPIGIFDSGMGGLTVAKAITDLLPKESIVYFGDTAHAPWGDKSSSTVQNYALKICDVLLEHKCKYIVIACHTASAIAYDAIKEHVGNHAHVINVIDPVVNYIQGLHANKKIGLIGTKQTIRSNTYKNRLEILNLNIELSVLATPLLVPLIEEGFKDKPISNMVVSEYLSNPNLKDIHALILACTHYPLIKEQIHQFYNNKVELIDAAEITAKTLKADLLLKNLMNSSKNATHLFYASDNNEFFTQTTSLFFQNEIVLKHYPF
jgi:glutamate racemase